MYSPVGEISGPPEGALPGLPEGAALPWLPEEVVWPWLPEEPEEVVCWAIERVTVPMINAMDTAISHPDDLVRMRPTPPVAQHPFTVSERPVGASLLLPQKSSEQRAGS